MKSSVFNEITNPTVCLTSGAEIQNIYIQTVSVMIINFLVPMCIISDTQGMTAGPGATVNSIIAALAAAKSTQTANTITGE